MKPGTIALFLAAAALRGQSVAPALPSGNVAVPLEEYNTLVDLAARPTAVSAAPPVSWVVNSTALALQVTADSVSGTATIAGEVLVSGSHKVPLASGLIVLDAHRSGAELPLERDGDVLSALLGGPDAFFVTLDVAAPLVIEPGRASLTIPVPAAGSGRLSLTLPGEQTQVNLTPGLITSRTSGGGHTVVEAVLEPGKPATLWWASRLNGSIPAAVAKEVRFLSDLKSLVSVNETDLEVAALADVSVVQGDPTRFDISLPAGYELRGVTGPDLVSSTSEAQSVQLNVRDGAARSHQFLITLGRAVEEAKADVPLPGFVGSQRETGEVLISGEGAMELTAHERAGLRRMDVKEASPALAALARSESYAAFRYQTRAGEAPGLGLEWVRFPEGQVAPAVATRAEATTLVTREGRSLTEVRLTLRNQAQPFMKVNLPPGASVLSAEVAGEKVKPVEGTDGSRIPLLRTGFRPSGVYQVSFVFLHAGAPFARKGASELGLPKMDVPIGRVEWELFLPHEFQVDNFSGDAVAQDQYSGWQASSGDPSTRPGSVVYTGSVGAGQIGGLVTDPTGAVISGAAIAISFASGAPSVITQSDRNGRWLVSGIVPGRAAVKVTSPGFSAMFHNVDYTGAGVGLSSTLQVGSVSETVSVTASVMPLQTMRAEVFPSRKAVPPPPPAPSVNVQNLQQRVSGVLPITVSVPRSGTSWKFVRPLVVDEETKLTFRYRSH
jgi:hypothetical protein